MSNFADNLKNLRSIKGTPQKDLSLLLGVTIRQYQRYEAGASEPNINGLIALADYFDVSIDYLVGRSDDPGRR